MREPPVNECGVSLYKLCSWSASGGIGDPESATNSAYTAILEVPVNFEASRQPRPHGKRMAAQVCAAGHGASALRLDFGEA